MNEFADTKRLRAEAKYRGNAIFQHTVRCSKCGTFDCYTNKPKGRACVECSRRSKAKQDPELKKIINRESYNRNRPSHNPEKILHDGVRRAGFLQAGVSNQAEYDALENKAELLKMANGTEAPKYTLDHVEPAAGFEHEGVKYHGMTKAENLRLETIERNKAKAGKRVNETLDLSMVTVKPSDAIEVTKGTTTEELRSLFYRFCGISTKPNSTYNKGEKLNPDEERKFFKEALTEGQALRAATVLEIMMAGRSDLLEPSEKNPLPWFWDEAKKARVQKQIVVNDKLHSPETLSAASHALNWLDDAMFQVSMAKAVRADWCADFATVSPFGEVFYQADIIDRIERHFIEWACNWFQRIEQEKPIFDFVGLVDPEKFDSWFTLRRKEADLRSAVSVANADFKKAGAYVKADDLAYGLTMRKQAQAAKAKAEADLQAFIDSLA